MTFIDARVKGLPHSTAGVRLAEIGIRGWNVLNQDLPLPLAVLRRSALENNRRWMRDFVASTGARLAPHGKTHMSPELFRMQLADGAWAITLATIQQVRVAREAGVTRILLANQIVGSRDIEYILDEMHCDPSFEFYCLVDSLEGVRRLAEAVAPRTGGRPLRVLIESGYQGGRAGCRSVEEALAVARAVRAAHPNLALHGVEGFEGLYQYLPVAEGVPRVRQFLADISGLAQRIDEAGLFGADEIVLSAGGSAYYDLVAEEFARVRLSRPTAIVLRCGCYLTHDAGTFEHFFTHMLGRSSVARSIGARFESALEVWCYVLSVPERGRAILGAGRRDFGHDLGNPTPLRQFRPGKSREPNAIPGHEIVAINDQHAHMTMPDGADVQVGDMIALGVSHPCTTFDKWRLLHIVDDDYAVVSAIQTFF